MNKKKGPCSYNIGVQCDGSDCSRCGWCPSVEERRLSNLRGPDALTAEKADKAYFEERIFIMGNASLIGVKCTKCGGAYMTSDKYKYEQPTIVPAEGGGKDGV